MSRLGRLCLIATMALSCSGCESKDKDSHTVPHLMRNMKTQCVGRYLLDLPESFKRIYLPAGSTGDATFYFGHGADFRTVNVTVVAHPVTPERFESAIAERAGALAGGVNYETNGSMLLDQEAWSSLQVRLVYHASTEVADAQVHELHMLVKDTHVVIGTTAFEAAQIAAAESRLHTILDKINSVTDPGDAGPGVCLGPVVVDAGSDYEELQLGFRAADRAHSDLLLQVSLNTFLQPDGEPSLIARGESNLAGLGVKRKVLKKGKLQLAGMDGEQWLGRFDDGDSAQHGFYAETDIRRPSSLHPKLMLEMFTGGESDSGEPVASSLSDEQAILLWERIVGSFRVRPGG